MVEPNNKEFTIEQQCELLGLARSSYYYKKRDRIGDKELMDLIDIIYEDRPYFGSRRIRTHIVKNYGIKVGRKRVRSLMRKMGLIAVYPKKSLSIANKEHVKYPYLLKNIEIKKPNQVWGTDITYIRMKKGWLYMIAVIDWFSRYIVSYEVSTTLEIGFCINAIKKAYGKAKTDIINMDQGSHFTSEQFLSIPMRFDSKISMDSKGRALDNIFTERFWRTLKYEEVYIKDYETVQEAKEGIRKYVNFYNNERYHSSLEDQTPAEVYFGTNILPVKNISKKSSFSV